MFRPAIATGAGDAQLPKAFLDFAIYAIVGVGAVMLVRLPPPAFMPGCVRTLPCADASRCM